MFRVTATYAATAYIIIEVTNNLVGPFRLPEWIPTLVAILLAIGLPVIIILSWIFDFTTQGIKKTESLEELAAKEIVTKPVKRRIRSSDVIIAVLLVAVVILAWPRIFKRDTLERLRSSGERIAVAVMPFQNMTNDTIWDVWQDGIQNELITSLTNAEDLVVRQVETVKELIQSKGLNNYASLTPSVATSISRKLDADILINGTIKQSKNLLRVNAQLIDAKTKEPFKSFELDGSGAEKDIIPVIDSLKQMLTNYLIISKLKKEVSPEIQNIATTNSPSAYRYFILGNKAISKRDHSTAIIYFTKAIELDSNFTYAAIRLSNAYWNLFSFDQAKKWCLRVREKKDQIPVYLEAINNVMYALLFESPVEATKYIEQQIELDSQSPLGYSNLGYNYIRLRQYDKAAQAFERSLDIYKKWNVKPIIPGHYQYLGLAYHKTGRFKKEKKLYKKAEKDFPDDAPLVFRQASLALSLGKDKEANRQINKYISLLRENHNLRFILQQCSPASIQMPECQTRQKNIIGKYYRWIQKIRGRHTILHGS